MSVYPSIWLSAHLNSKQSDQPACNITYNPSLLSLKLIYCTILRYSQSYIRYNALYMIIYSDRQKIQQYSKHVNATAMDSTPLSVQKYTSLERNGWTSFLKSWNSRSNTIMMQQQPYTRRYSSNSSGWKGGGTVPHTTANAMPTISSTSSATTTAPENGV